MWEALKKISEPQYMGVQVIIEDGADPLQFHIKKLTFGDRQLITAVIASRIKRDGKAEDEFEEEFAAIATETTAQLRIVLSLCDNNKQHLFNIGGTHEELIAEAAKVSAFPHELANPLIKAINEFSGYNTDNKSKTDK